MTKIRKTMSNLYNELTKRQQEISRLIALGFSSDEIAKKLFISPSTVKTHVYAIADKLRVFGTGSSSNLRCKIVTVYWKNNIQELQELDLEEIC